MPYDIAKDFDGCAYAVVKMTPGGKELAPGGCHPTAIEAGKHLAALEAATSYEGRAAGEWVIVDIDGTLTVSDGSDEPRESLVSWMRANDYSYAIVSARPDSRLDETRAWLESNDIPHSSVSLSDFPQGPNAGVAFKKSKAEQLLKNHKIAFAIDNDPAARSAYESAGVKAVGPTTVRYFQLGLELRHPGHADQSVHNPHKGGGATSSFVRPKAIERTIDTENAEKLTDSEWKATAYAHRLTPDLTDGTALPSEVPSRIDIKAVEAYQSGSGNFQQAVLSPQSQMEPGVRTQVADFTAVLERNSLQEDTTLYRGMGGVMGGSQMSDNLRFAGVGGVVKTNRFVSSSANSRVAETFGEADLVIRAPAGTKGAYLDRIVYADPKYAPVRKYDVAFARKVAIPGRGEAEFVMPPGVKFRVDSTSQSPSGRARFEVTVVP